MKVLRLISISIIVLPQIFFWSNNKKAIKYTKITRKLLNIPKVRSGNNKKAIKYTKSKIRE